MPKNGPFLNLLCVTVFAFQRQRARDRNLGLPLSIWLLREIDFDKNSYLLEKTLSIIFCAWALTFQTFTFCTCALTVSLWDQGSFQVVLFCATQHFTVMTARQKPATSLVLRLEHLPQGIQAVLLSNKLFKDPSNYNPEHDSDSWILWTILKTVWQHHSFCICSSFPMVSNILVWLVFFIFYHRCSAVFFFFQQIMVGNCHLYLSVQLTY